MLSSIAEVSIGIVRHKAAFADSFRPLVVARPKACTAEYIAVIHFYLISHWPFFSGLQVPTCRQ